MAAGGTTTTTYTDGKVTRFSTTFPMLEMNGEQFPQQNMAAPLHMNNVCFDKINANFIAIGYEVAFESR